MQPELYKTESSFRIYIEGNKHRRMKNYSSVTYFKFEAKDSDLDITETTEALNKYV